MKITLECLKNQLKYYKTVKNESNLTKRTERQ